MANNYIELSAFLKVAPEKIEKAKEVLEAIITEADNCKEWGYCSFDATVEDTGVWFRHNETVIVEQVEAAASRLLEELEIDEPFFCSWAYTCSKPRVNEFGGGAFVMKRGKPTKYVDAMNKVEAWAHKYKW